MLRLEHICNPFYKESVQQFQRKVNVRRPHLSADTMDGMDEVDGRRDGKGRMGQIGRMGGLDGYLSLVTSAATRSRETKIVALLGGFLLYPQTATGRFEH